MFWIRIFSTSTLEVLFRSRARLWPTWFAKLVPFAVLSMIPLHAAEAWFTHPEVEPPSTVIHLLPLRLMQESPAQYGALILALGSNSMVTGEFDAPFPFAVREVEMVPHKCTVVPGPI